MFEQISLALNLVLFVVGAVVIWWSGTRLERTSDTIAKRTGMGSAMAGLVLLAVATSLPEIVTTVTSVFRGNVELAVHNLLGGTTFQVVVLAIADTAGRRGPLTGYRPSFATLLQASGVIAMLGMATCGLMVADRAQFAVPLGFGAVGLHPVMLLLPVAYFVIVRLTHRASGFPRWKPVGGDEPARGRERPDGGAPGRHSLRALVLIFTALAALVTSSGWLIASVADAMAAQTGLTSAFVGATLLAAATSLPEISTTVTAARDGNEEMALSNVMGSNSFDVALLALTSILAGSAFSAGMTAVFMAGLAIVLTSVYLMGLLERSQRAVAKVGFDSLTVVALYAAGVVTLFLTR